MKLLILIFLFVSCTASNHSLHEMNLQNQHDKMIIHDINMKKKITNTRKRGVRAYSKSKKAHTNTIHTKRII